MKISKYMLFQCLGWVIFTFLNVYTAILTDEFTPQILIINFALLVLGISLTHMYRNWIIKHNWLKLGTEKLLLFVILANLVLTVAYILGYYVLCMVVLKQNSTSFTTEQLIGNVAAVFLLLAIWNAFYFSWNYVERNRLLLIQQLRMESDLKDLEIKSIKANLQPHFIFNALNSIRALIDEDPKLAREAVTHISNILRSSIAQKKELDTLQNEIALLEDYLALEKIRYEHRLHFDKKCEEDTLQKMVPTMMLQTLAENAIKHGISAMEEGGIIELETFMEKKNLHIILRNSGKLDLSKVHEESLSFGLNATQQRLRYFFKEKATFELIQEKEFVKTHIIIQP